MTELSDYQRMVEKPAIARYEARLAAAGKRITDLEQALAEARGKALEEAAQCAENWEPVENLLPLCDLDANEAAMTGQWEARERIVDAIRALNTHPDTMNAKAP